MKNDISKAEEIKSIKNQKEDAKSNTDIASKSNEEIPLNALRNNLSYLVKYCENLNNGDHEILKLINELIFTTFKNLKSLDEKTLEELNICKYAHIFLNYLTNNLNYFLKKETSISDHIYELSFEISKLKSIPSSEINKV